MSALSGGEGSKSRSSTVVKSESDACDRVETGGSDVMLEMYRGALSIAAEFGAEVDVLRWWLSEIVEATATQWRGYDAVKKGVTPAAAVRRGRLAL